MFSKDVRLPAQMQRAMAAEAEAMRESKAKVNQSTEVVVIGAYTDHKCVLLILYSVDTLEN